MPWSNPPLRNRYGYHGVTPHPYVIAIYKTCIYYRPDIATWRSCDHDTVEGHATIEVESKADTDAEQSRMQSRERGEHSRDECRAETRPEEQRTETRAEQRRKGAEVQRRNGADVQRRKGAKTKTGRVSCRKRIRKH